jgi:uncharacterized protein YjlB
MVVRALAGLRRGLSSVVDVFRARGWIDQWSDGVREQVLAGARE